MALNGLHHSATTEHHIQRGTAPGPGIRVPANIAPADNPDPFSRSQTGPKDGS